jgi:quercetin dioxygenase-like cupin family protein
MIVPAVRLRKVVGARLFCLQRSGPFSRYGLRREVLRGSIGLFRFAAALSFCRKVTANTLRAALVRLLGWPFTIKLDGPNGNTQDFFVFTDTMKPGQTIPFHKHDNAEEILFVEEGGATVIVGDQRAVAGPRSIVFIPGGTWISATNTGKQDIHLLALFSRHGYEQYMRALGVKQGEPMNPLSPDELTRLRALGHSSTGTRQRVRTHPA